jgi:hypothetical protein
MFIACACSATFEPYSMKKSSVPPHLPAAFHPSLVADYVEATNNFHLKRLMVTFAEDALLNGQLRDYWGKPTFRAWAKRDIIRDELTMSVTR